MPTPNNNSYLFDEFLLDIPTNVLFRSGERVDLTLKASEILKVLIENSGTVVSREELMRTVWPDSFVEEANLSHHIFKLRQALGESDSRKFIETVPKRGYRFVGTLQIASEPEPVTVPRTAFGKLGLAAAVALLLTLSGITAWLLFNQRSDPPAAVAAESVRTIAVMPFVNESGNDDVEYLASGMTETLINSLSQVGTLAVKPRATVYRYKGKDITPAAVGSELNVQSVLFGRITQRGDELTLYLSLVDTNSEYQIWGKQFVRKLSDLASFQNEIGREVATSLEARLTGGDEQSLAKGYSKNGEAYRRYLLGRYYWNKFTGHGLKKAIESFEGAIKLDPNYSLAYAGLADSYCVLGVNGHISRDEAAVKVREAATRAVEAGNDLAGARQAMGAYKMFFEWDLEGANREFVRAIELDPGFAAAHELYSYSLLAQRRYEESLSEIQKAAELEPTSLIILGDLAAIYRYMGQLDKALELDRRIVEMDPNYAQGRFGLAHVLSRMGDHDGAVREITKGIELSGGSTRLKACLGVVYARAGRKAEAQKVIDDLVANRSKERVALEDIAMIYSVMGEKDRAFEWLEKAYEERSCWLYELNADPDWEPLRDDPRYADLARRIGIG